MFIFGPTLGDQTDTRRPNRQSIDFFYNERIQKYSGGPVCSLYLAMASLIYFIDLHFRYQ